MKRRIDRVILGLFGFLVAIVIFCCYLRSHMTPEQIAAEKQHAGIHAETEAEQAVADAKAVKEKALRIRDQANGHAWLLAKKYVNDRLKSPSTADFQSMFNADIRSLGDGKYQVISFVDSQNGFGAMIRTHFECSLQTPDGDHWLVTNLSTW